ncbi:MAG: DUF2283 domain-containing protein [Cytophagaceae bacterium]|nr:DUF2283 domain-containing protein [Cytophagaceae bacterium]
MKISYDETVDALYIRLVEGEHQCRTMRLTDEISLNLGAGELLVGIEVLDASNVLANEQLPQLLVENLPTRIAA